MAASLVAGVMGVSIEPCLMGLLNVPLKVGESMPLSGGMSKSESSSGGERAVSNVTLPKGVR